MKKPKWTYRFDGHVFTVTKYEEHEDYTCADRWDEDFNDGNGPTEEEFMFLVRQASSKYLKNKHLMHNKSKGIGAWAIEVDAKFEPERNEFGVVSP